jgi:hypothetical protein
MDKNDNKQKIREGIADLLYGSQFLEGSETGIKAKDGTILHILEDDAHPKLKEKAIVLKEDTFINGRPIHAGTKLIILTESELDQ